MGVEKLFGVFPLVEGARFVDAFVTLQADELVVKRCRSCFGQFGFARTGWAFGEDRLLEFARQIQSGSDMLGCDVVLTGQVLSHGWNGAKHGRPRLSRGSGMECRRQIISASGVL